MYVAIGGEVIIAHRRACAPCAKMDEALGEGGFQAIRRPAASPRGGVRGGNEARAASKDDVGRLADLADRALGAVEPGDGPALARWLAEDGPRHRRVLSIHRYEAIAAKLHE